MILFIPSYSIWLLAHTTWKEMIDLYFGLHEYLIHLFIIYIILDRIITYNFYTFNKGIISKLY